MMLVMILVITAGLADGDKLSTGSQLRDRSHIATTLGLRNDVAGNEKFFQFVGSELSTIYRQMISPVESLYNYNSFEKSSLTDAEFYAKPLVLFIGPWSTGKTTMINYLLGIENTSHALYTGPEPTTTEFTAIYYGPKYRSVKGNVLIADTGSQFAGLETFGQGFLERVEGIEMPIELLQWITIVDTPGIIENRRQHDRGYPFNDFMKWFIDRAAVILVMFDPSQLDAGLQLESVIKQWKGRESVVRFVLNKADSVELHELMRAHAAIFWNLSPLINATGPPHCYVGSFHSLQFRGSSVSHGLFQLDELALLHQLHGVMTSGLKNNMAVVRQHALRVLTHANMVSAYKAVFEDKKSFWRDNTNVWSRIVATPEKHGVYRHVLEQSASQQVAISYLDLPHPDRYKAFFRTFSLDSFKQLSHHCDYWSGKCLVDDLKSAINDKLPQLMLAIQKFLREIQEDTCDARSGSCPTG